MGMAQRQGNSRRKLHGMYDWLRHASSDPHDYVDFPPRLNEYLLWACSISFEKIFRGRSPYTSTFQAYFVLWLMPEMPKFREGADAFMPNGLSVEEASALERLDFFTKLTEMFGAEILAAQKSRTEKYFGA